MPGLFSVGNRDKQAAVADMRTKAAISAAVVGVADGWPGVGPPAGLWVTIFQRVVDRQAEPAEPPPFTC